MGYGRQTGDYKEFGSPFTIAMPAVTVSGTAASDVALAGTTYRVPFACKFVGASRVATTGGTSANAGPNMQVQMSLAGTGTWTSIGTSMAGTDASGTGRDFSVATGTSANLAAGDQVRMCNVAGTAASQQVCDFLLVFVDLYA